MEASNEKRPGGLTNAQYETLVHRAAQDAAALLEQRVAFIFYVGKIMVRVVVWMAGAVSVAVGLWHHEALMKILFG